MKTIVQKQGVRTETRDDYLDLVRAFPLRPIRDDASHAHAVRVLSTLLARARLTSGERDYAEALTRFVKDYDERAYPFPRGRHTPRQVLRYLMRQAGMNTEALGQVLGSQPAASLVLNGKRELSKGNILKLAARFKVDPGLLLVGVRGRPKT